MVWESLASILPKINLNLTKEFSKTTVRETETQTLQIKDEDGKKRTILIVCCGSGKFAFRDFTKTLGQKLEEYKILLEKDLINLEQYNTLSSQAIKEESQDVCQENNYLFSKNLR